MQTRVVRIVKVKDIHTFHKACRYVASYNRTRTDPSFILKNNYL